MVVELIEAGRFNAFADALRFLLAVKGSGIHVASASSSKNAKMFLRHIRLDTFADEQDLRYDFLRPGLTSGLRRSCVLSVSSEPDAKGGERSVWSRPWWRSVVARLTGQRG
jgi:hypothetical protein